jgi:hypothetical protein
MKKINFIFTIAKIIVYAQLSWKMQLKLNALRQHNKAKFNQVAYKHYTLLIEYYCLTVNQQVTWWSLYVWISTPYHTTLNFNNILLENYSLVKTFIETVIKQSHGTDSHTMLSHHIQLN